MFKQSFSVLLLFAASHSAMAGVDLILNNDDLLDPVAAGGISTYEVSVSNDGTDTSTGTTVVLEFPDTTIFTSASGVDLTCDAVATPIAGNLLQITCDLGSLITLDVDPAATKTITLELETTTAGAINLDATASSDVVDDIPANNFASQLTTVNQGADLQLSKTGPASAQSSSNITYAFTVTNDGPDTATDIQITDTIPTGFTLISVPAGCSDDGITITCNALSLANGNSTTFTPIIGQLTAAGGSTVTNTASVDVLSGPADPDTNNNTAVLNTTVTAGTDMFIAKSRDVAGNFLVGDTFNFILEPAFSGDAPNTITVTDTIPVEYSIDVGNFAISQNGWSCGVVGQTITCTQASGGSAGFNQSLGDISIPVQAITSGVNVTNTTSISALSPSDTNLANNTADDSGVDINAPIVDLGINKIGPSPALTVVGVPFNYNFDVTNNGSADFTGPITLTDNLPANLTFNSVTTANGWVCIPASGVGPIVITCDQDPVTIAAGDDTAGPVLEVVATAVGPQNNSVAISTTTCNFPADPNNCLGDPADDTDSFETTSSTNANSADISIIKEVAIADVPAGEVQTYTLEIVNAGPDTAADVDIDDLFERLLNSDTAPTNAGYISETVTENSATLNSCTSTASGNSKRRLNCNFINIPVCTQNVNCPIINIQVRQSPSGSITNIATAVSQTTADPNTSNNTDSTTSTISPRADVFVNVSDTPDPATAGQTLTYVITASNLAPSFAVNVTTTDTLPHDVTFVSAIPSTGNCTTTPTPETTTTAGNDTIICKLGTFLKGAIGSPVQQTVTVVVRPNTITRGTTLTYDTTVSTTTTEVAGGAANNTNSTTTDVLPPVLNLIVNKTEDIDPVAVGDNTVYEITVTNDGPSTAENVTFTDSLPAGFLSYQSITMPAGVVCPTLPAVGDASGAQVICNLGNVIAGDSVIVEITMQGETKGIASNSVTVSSDEVGLGFETSPVDNTATQNTTVRSKADMEVFNKQAQNLSGNPIASVNLREDFQFLIEVRNNVGANLAEADEVQVTDNLPAGMELTGTPAIAIVSGSTTLTSCTGVATDTSFVCDLGTVSSGGVFNIIVPVQIVIAPAGAITNTATVSTDSRDTVPANDSSSGSIINGNVITSSIAGRVFRDFDNNGLFDAADTGIAGITMTLSGNTFDGAPVGAVNAISDANGNYAFTGLPASDASGYTVTEGVINNIDLVDGIDTAGSLNGNVSVNDQISAIVLPDDTIATNYLFAEIPIPRIGIAKSAGGVTNNGDGTFSVNFTLNVENAGGTPLSNIQISDALAVFGNYTSNAIPALGQYTISSAPVINNQLNNASLTANAGFTGSGANTFLLTAANSNLPDFDTGAANHSRAEITFGIRFFPVSSGTLNNTANITGTSSTGQNVTDDSVDGTIPDANADDDPNNDTSPTPVVVNFAGLNIIKTTGTVVQTGPLAFDVPFTLIINNTAGSGVATFVQISDDLTATFPTAQTLNITAPTVISACTGTVLTASAAAFDGSAQINLLNGNQNLQIGEQCQLDFTVNVDFAGNALPATQTNTAQASTANSAGGAPTTIVSDTSTVGFAGFVIDPDIALTKTTGSIIQTGLHSLTVPYTLIVANNGTADAPFVQVTDNLQATFPTAQTINITTPVAISNCTGSVLNIASPAFNGTTQTKLLLGTQTLQINEQCQIDFKVDVDYGNNALPATQNNIALATTALSLNGNATDSATDSSSFNLGNLASVSGRVWRDNNHDRLDNNEPGVKGFIVEILNSNNKVVGTAVTDNNGNYTINNLFPSIPGDPTTQFSIRFIDQNSGAIFGAPVSSDPVNANGAILGGSIIGLSLSAGVNTINQSLPLDPSGIIYDSRTRQPIENAQITIAGPTGFNPTLHLVGGTNNVNQTTGADGFYQYLLLPTAPVGTYTLTVKEPAGYLPGGSRVIPVCSNTLNVTATPDPALIHNRSTAPVLSAPAHNPNNCASSTSAAVNNNASTQYYLSFVLTAGVSADVVNNHIPLDIISDGALTLVKSTPKLNVIRSELIPYTILANNNFSEILANIDVVDQIPPGFKYKVGSGRMNGVALEPTVNGRSLTWSNLNFSANEQRNFNLLLIVGGGVSEGEFINQAWASNNINSQTISNIATATVRVIPDPTFDCSDIIGKVFDDKNLNGYPDEGEETLPGIRLATARGWLVTTDNYGRYHITCAAVPNSARGSNFIIKLDERTLPSGYRITTENPRVVRLTRGKITKANFGATIHRVVRLDIAADAFELSSSELKLEYVKRIDGLLDILKKSASVLRINYLADYETQSLAEDRLEKAKDLISEKWQAIDCCYDLILEEELHWRTGKPRSPSNNNGGSN